MPECPQLKVTNADFAECNGDYLYSYSLRVSWAPDRPVYVHTDRCSVEYCEAIPYQDTSDYKYANLYLNCFLTISSGQIMEILDR